MVFVVRNDLKMGKGKVAAQVNSWVHEGCSVYIYNVLQTFMFCFCFSADMRLLELTSKWCVTIQRYTASIYDTHSVLTMTYVHMCFCTVCQLLYRWESAGCMKVVVKAPDEQTLWVLDITGLQICLDHWQTFWFIKYQ